MTRSSFRILFTLLAVLVLGAFVAACGDDDESSDTPTTFGPNIGASRCHPIPAPGGYRVTRTSANSAGSMPANVPARSHIQPSGSGTGSAATSFHDSYWYRRPKWTTVRRAGCPCIRTSENSSSSRMVTTDRSSSASRNGS